MTYSLQFPNISNVNVRNESTFYKKQKYKILMHRTDGTIEEHKKLKNMLKMGVCLIDDD